MDFVTITDHDTIAGALELADLPDTFVSEELTVWFKGEPQAVHVLCYGITPDDHEWLQAHNDDVEACAEYLHEHEITARARAPVLRGRGAADRRATAAAWRSSSRSGRRATGRAPRSSTCRRSSTSRPTAAPRSAAPTTTPASTSAARSPRRRRRATPDGVPRPHPRRPRRRARRPGQRRQVDARRDGAGDPRARRRREAGAAPTRRAVLKIVERVMREGDVRARRASAPTSAPRTRARCCAPGCAAMDLEIDERELLEHLQDGELSHPDLYRRARRIHERELAARRRARSWR